MYDAVAELLERRRTTPMGRRGNVVNIVSWLLLVLSMCSLVARLCMKLSIKNKSKRYGLDDLFVIFAAIFSIGHTIAASVESFQALDQRLEDLHPNQMSAYQKAEYAGCILYIANMGCARISLCFLIKKVLPGNVPHTTAYVFGGFTILWTLSGVLVTLFHCNFPDPWRFSGNRCIDITEWVNYVGITNIVVEVLLVSIPLIVWNLRTSAGKRLTLSLLFMARLSIVAAVSAQLYFLNKYSPIFSEYWRTVLCVQVAQNLSIITACLPVLHPFVIKVLAGSVQIEKIQYRCSMISQLLKFTRSRKDGGGGRTAMDVKYDPMASQTSGFPTGDKDEKKAASEYCRPLATYGLDRSSAHFNSQHFNRFPSKTSLPVADLESAPPKDIFMAPVQIPLSRPTTSYSIAPTETRNAPASHSRSNSRARPSHSRNASNPCSHSRTSSEAPQMPQALSEVGVLPLIDWDTDSSSDRDSGRSSLSRRPNSEYVFNRSKVISVPEESHLRDDRQESYKKYYPPLPSPGMPKKPPRNF